MKTLVIFRRLEIWILLTVIIALAMFALRTEPVSEAPQTVDVTPAKVLPEKKKDAEVAGTEEPVETGLIVEEVSVSGTQQGKMVELTLLGRSKTGAEAPVTEATLIAETDAGDPVRHFFEPFKQEQAFLPDEDSLVTVRLWLEQPAEFIWLDFQGRKVKTELPR